MEQQNNVEQRDHIGGDPDAYREVFLPLDINSLKMTVQSPRSLASPTMNKLASADRAFHDWYRFILSFPAHVVRNYAIGKFGLRAGAAILDPFCGTGTTVVEAKRLGLVGVGLEANQMAYFASRVKSDWSGNPNDVEALALQIAEAARKATTRARRLRTLSDVEMDLILTNSISEVPLHKTLLLREIILNSCDGIYRDYALLCLARCAVETASNLHFGPEVGVRGRRADAEVVGGWLHAMRNVVADLRMAAANESNGAAEVYFGDARDPRSTLEHQPVECVFTSPPYPNEKDYTRTTRLESVLLGFLSDKSSLRSMKSGLLRSNTRNIYKGDSDDQLVANVESVQNLSIEIENRRLALGKTSGFEKLYAKVTLQYFGGMARHFRELRHFLRPGAMLGYVVGDQASYFRVLIPTSRILAELAQTFGYEHVGTDLFRTRIATATKSQMEEHVLLLRWPG